MFPVATNNGIGSRDASLVEEMSSDSLHGRGLTGRPHPGPAGEVGANHRVDEGIAGDRASFPLKPLHGGAPMAGQLRTSCEIGHLDDDLDLGLSGECR